jgi:hypothetical protein
MPFQINELVLTIGHLMFLVAGMLGHLLYASVSSMAHGAHTAPTLVMEAAFVVGCLVHRQGVEGTLVMCLSVWSREGR